ncbi:MAG: DNA-binding protein [Spirochaetaceae bacterium]|jgi:hypothetical protein|nr:DNA-binding protein [Spirochaetaceae bacterium]
MEKKPTQYVIDLTGCHKSTAEKWAGKNGVEAIRGPNGRIVMFFWSEEDIARFKARPKQGKRAKKDKNQDKDKEQTVSG